MDLNARSAGAPLPDLVHASRPFRAQTGIDHDEQAHAGAGGGAARAARARRDSGRAGQLPGVPRKRPLDVHGPPERREAPAPRRPGLVREVGPRRHAPLHRLSHRQGRLPARVEALQGAARRDGGLLRAVQEAATSRTTPRPWTACTSQLAQQGNRQAALCVDCHGSHAIGRPGEPRTRVSDTCSNCHKKVFDVYGGSVHGKAVTQGNPDVPVCTDCHRAHDVADPRAGALSLRTAETLRPLPHRPEADEALRALHQRRRDLPGRLPRHGGDAPEGQEGEGRPPGGRAAPTATACTTSSAPTTRSPR